ncbi:MAG TPA: glycosyltransferase family 4 protein [Stellaceae bacterium]|nr:glycosyltransferase family 4 protein [Stellaceae bacterium]
MSGEWVALAAQPLAIAFTLMFALALLTTGKALQRLRARAILDRPNERSSHAVATPRGGGIGILAALLPAWLIIVLLGYSDAAPLAAIAAAIVLAVVSWRDDVGGLSPALRLTVQALAVIIGMAFLPGAGTVFQDLLPPALDRVAAAIVWLWFINAFNFMDGIDGIAGTEAAAIGAGIALLALAHLDVVGLGTGLFAAATAGAALGFLCWNWQPAKLFMGEVGSVPLGYLLGWLLLTLAGAGYWAPALILPLYFLADASLTLLRRLARGEKIWQPHRQHFYQRAVQAGRSHAAVVLRVLAADLVLIGAALWSTEDSEVPALILAAVAVAVLLAELSRSTRPATEPG